MFSNYARLDIAGVKSISSISVSECIFGIDSGDMISLLQDFGGMPWSPIVHIPSELVLL